MGLPVMGCPEGHDRPIFAKLWTVLTGHRTAGGKINLCVGRRSRPTHKFFLPYGPEPGSI